MRPAASRLAPAVWIVAAIKLAAHLLTTGRFGYGYFVDELYFLSCADHLAWGYVDMPPLHAALTALLKATVGDSLWALRIPAALAGAALVLLTGMLARDLGGGRFAQGLAGLCVLVAPIWLSLHSLFTMNAWEPLIWMGLAILLVRLVDGANPRLWLLFGALAGLGLLNKHTTAMFGLGVVAGLLASPQRRFFRSPWIWLGGAVAVLVVLPNLIWNMREGWPFFELQAAIREDRRNVELSPLSFLLQQVLFLLPATAPVWMAGLWSLLAGSLRRYRALGIAFLTVLAILLAANGRVYYLAPAYPILLAAGGVATERFAAKAGRGWLRPALAGVIALVGITLAPMALPCLPPQTYIAYVRAIGMQPPAIETHRMGPLPQLFADRFGWKEMAEVVARAFHGLTPEEQKRARVFGQNYGQAGAIDLYGPALGLPKALSGHLAYHDWGPPKEDPEVLIVMDDEKEVLERYFASVEPGGRVTHPYSMPYQHFDVWICRRPKISLRELWPRLRELG